MSEEQNIGVTETGQLETPMDGAPRSFVECLKSVIEGAQAQKRWTPPLNAQARELLAEVLLAQQADSVLGLLEPLPIEVVETAFAQSWGRLPAESQAGLLKALGERTDKKLFVRQAGIAEKLFAIDSQAAINLLASVIANHKQTESPWPELQEYKIEQLRIRFLTSDFDWHLVSSPNTKAMKLLLAAFVQVASHPEAFKNEMGQRCVYDFTRWAATTTQQLQLNDALLQEVARRIYTLSRRLTSGWKQEIEELISKLTPSLAEPPSSAIPQVPDEKLQLISVMTERSIDERAPNSAAPGTNESEGGEAQAASRRILGHASSATEAADTTGAESTVSSPLPERLTETEPLPSQAETVQPSLPTDTVDVTELVERKQSEVEQRRSSITHLQTELDFLEREIIFIKQLGTERNRLRDEKDDLAGELKQARETISDLQMANTALEQNLETKTRNLREAQQRAQQLSAVAEGLRNELEEERNKRLEEQRLFAEQIERSVSNSVNEFKGRLAAALNPIFENQSGTDDHPLSERLAGFLRHWLKDIKQILKNQGVSIS